MRLNAKSLKRGMIMMLIFILIGVVLLVELFKIQVLGYDDYYDEVFEQLTVETRINGERGSIYDRNGKLLASNKTVWALYICPRNIENPEFVARGIAEITGKKYEDILDKAKKTGYKLQVIDTDIEEQEAKEIRKFIDDNNLTDQIQLNASYERYYPFSTLASHSLGFVNADGVGIYGLEKYYNNILEGTGGRYITAQNAQGGDMPFQYEELLQSENGYNLVTTIDLYIQYQLEAQLKAASIESGAQNRSAGIVMNPKTGEIYAMAVYPAFDLNDPFTLDSDSQIKLNEYEKGTKEYKNTYLNLLFGMWNNKAVTELYEPGSTFKLVTTSVALEEGTASLSNMFTCTGSLKVDGFYRAISCHKRTGHGTITFAQALQQSCNPSMMKLAFGIGREKFYEYFKKFGYTARTNIDLPSEAVGYYHSFNDFSNVSLAVYSFGQTFKTTAIQQIRAISAVANGGYSVTPHFIKSIVDKNGETVYEHEPIRGEQIISQNVSKTISNILKEGVDGEGGAKNAYVAGYSVAAKTGTSEKKDKYDETGATSYRVSSCIAYAPTEDAQVAVIIMVDEPSIGSKYGSVVAAPYVSSLLELILPYLGVEPTYRAEDEEFEQHIVPQLEGKTVEDAIAELSEKNIKFEIVGEGNTVISQMPRANSSIYVKNGKIILYTGQENNFMAEVPLVVGKSAEEANKILVNSGFNVKIEGALDYKYGQAAVVTWQSAEAEERLPRGEIITIKVLFVNEKD